VTEPGRTRWTDDRLDDLALEIRGLRSEMRDGFQALRAEMSGLRAEVHDDLGALRAETHADSRSLWSEIAASRRRLLTLQVTTVLGFIAVLIPVSLR